MPKFVTKDGKKFYQTEEGKLIPAETFMEGGLINDSSGKASEKARKEGGVLSETLKKMKPPKK